VAFFWFPDLLVQSRIEDERLSSGTLDYLFRAVSKVSGFLYNMLIAAILTKIGLMKVYR
jgi:hypothetical protein